MDAPKVSIIVPVYKVERYLQQCVDSIRNQTLREIEIILVDDGSPDRCPQMCDQFAMEDERIRVIHQENAGVSVARNRGIDEATADWIMFVDSDDWLELDAVERLWKKGKDTEVDIVIFSNFSNYPDRQVSNISKTAKEQLFIIENFRDDLLGSVVIPPSLYKSLFPSELQAFSTNGVCWNKLYKLSTIIHFDIRFPTGITFKEDMIFNLRVLLSAQSIYYVPYCTYHYRLRSSSLCNSVSETEMDLHLQCMQEMKKTIECYHLGKKFVLCWNVNTVNIIFTLIRHRGMNINSLKFCSCYASEMATFIDNELCQEALANVSYCYMPSIVRKLFLGLVKHHMLKSALIISKVYYILFPHKNRNNYFK